MVGYDLYLLSPPVIISSTNHHHNHSRLLAYGYYILVPVLIYLYRMQWSET